MASPGAILIWTTQFWNILVSLRNVWNGAEKENLENFDREVS